MTVFVLADRQPQVGQAVLYRLRPTDDWQLATWNGKAWLIDEHTTQTARAHHQWAPAAQEAAPPTSRRQPHAPRRPPAAPRTT